MTQRKCPRCLQLILASDSLSFDGNEILYLDCRRPRDLSSEERALLFIYCFDHEVASCLACAQRFRQEGLPSDLLGNRTYLCPRCRTDLTESLRAHLYACVTLPQEIRRAARAVRDAAQRLVKQSGQLHDRADVLMVEAEAAVAALRETIRRVT
jgi:hypothetical protein